MGLCFVSRTLGLQRIDGCRSQPSQARKSKNGGTAGKQQRRGNEANGWGKEQVGGEGGWGSGTGSAGAWERRWVGVPTDTGGEISPHDFEPNRNL